MNSHLSTLLSGLNNVRKYIDINIATNTAVSNLRRNPTENTAIREFVELHDNFHIKKVFEYNSYIISIYGYFEQFIENILNDYLGELCNVVGLYEDFNAAIKKNNLDLTLELLASLHYPKYSHLSNKIIIQNLNDGINNNVPILNRDAFTHHPYNFRITVLNDFFSRIGIPGICTVMRNYEPMKSQLISMHGSSYNQFSLEQLFREIDDLSIRRNDVSHGVTPQLLSPQIVIEYIDFIKLFCHTLYRVLFNNYLEVYSDFKGSLINVNQIVGSSVFIAEFENTIIRVGTRVIIKKDASNQPQYILTEIREIRDNNISVQSVSVSSSKLLGIRLSKKFRGNCEFRIY